MMGEEAGPDMMKCIESNNPVDREHSGCRGASERMILVAQEALTPSKQDRYVCVLGLLGTARDSLSIAGWWKSQALRSCPFFWPSSFSL